jgi:hypothetical protein
LICDELPHSPAAGDRHDRRPQILSAVFLATSEHWKKNSAAFVLGAALSITIVVTAGYLLLNRASDEGASNDALYVVVLVLLLILALRTFLGRKTAKDIITSVTVGPHLAAHEDPWVHALPFIGLTLLLLSAPALAVLALGHRAEVFLPKVRDWVKRQLLGGQRGRDRVFHRDHAQQPRMTAG